jgi:hypothetical protein
VARTGLTTIDVLQFAQAQPRHQAQLGVKLGF